MRITNFYAKGRNCAALFIITLIISISATNAATFTVTKTADTNDGVCDADCSLREAIAAANAASGDDVVAFSALFNSPQTITLSGGEIQIVNAGNLTFNGAGNNLLTVSANHASRIFVLLNPATAVINNVKLTRGQSSNAGGAIYSGGNLTLNNVFITDSINGTGGGGGVYNAGRTLIVNGSVISGNTTAIANEEGTVTIMNSEIRNNTAGAIYNSRGIFNCTDSIIDGNTAQGAPTTNRQGTFTLNNVTVSNNHATGYNGGGGGILNFSDSFQMQAILNINNSRILNNTSDDGNGGGILNIIGQTTVKNSLIEGNRSIDDWGGGIYVHNGTFSIENSIVSNNSAILGGGIYNSDGNSSIKNTTIAGNTAVVSSNMLNVGGGIYSSYGPLTILNSTIVNNAASRGGGIYTSYNSLGLSNSIVADNISTHTTNPAPDYAGVLVSGGYNLIENTTGTNITGDTTGNILGQDPRLMPLGFYGGALPTVALQTTSPAIDAGDPNNYLVSDQRGVPRPQDGDMDGSLLPDIGAYERQISVYRATKIADTDDGVCDAADCSLREAINAANSSQFPDNAFVFNTAAFSTPVITLTLGELVLSGNRTFVVRAAGANMLTISGNNQSRIFSMGNNSSLSISGVKLTGGNGAGSNNSGFGGAIYNAGGFLAVTNAEISGNHASYGGAIYSGVNGGGTLDIDASVVKNNSADSDGGALVVTGITGSITGSILDNNSAGASGGGIYLFGAASNLALSKSTISNNSSNAYGGGIFSDANSSMNMSASTVTNNSSATGGGGLANGQNLSILNSTVAFNSTQGIGGGVLNNSGATLSLSNATVSTNTANIHGGGLYNYAFSSINSQSSTIAGNSAQGIGGGIFNSGNGTFISRNTIFSGNAAVTQSPNIEGVLNSQGYNLIENTGGMTISGTTAGNITGVGAQLLPLRNYGGATKTHALRPTSPAIDRGNVAGATTDQRGFARPYDFPNIPNGAGNGADIGAFERQPDDASGSTRFDFDGDGKSDISVFRPSNGVWYLNRSTAGFAGVSFGQNGDLIAPADFDGDGKTDLAVFRPSNGTWYILNSSDNSFTAAQFGLNGDLPRPADFDGDGKADISLFRPSNGAWYRINSSNGSFFGTFYGANGDKPLVADFDGDGKSDLALFRRSTASFYWVNSTNGAFNAAQFGLSTDIPTPGDYDGDGKTDIAVFRASNGTWYRVNSSNGTFAATQFGANGDTPTPGDYDGDGKADIAVFRPSNGNWYYQQSSNSGFVGVNFGIATDKPVPAAFQN